MRDCPCKDCHDRTVTCHGVCGPYREWKYEHDAREAAKRVQKGQTRPITQRALHSWVKRMKRGK